MNLDACLSIGDGETAVFSWFELHVHTARHSKIIVRNGGKGSEGRGKGRGGGRRMERLLTTATRLVELNGSKLSKKYGVREGMRKWSRKGGRRERRSGFN